MPLSMLESEILPNTLIQNKFLYKDKSSKKMDENNCQNMMNMTRHSAQTKANSIPAHLFYQN